MTGAGPVGLLAVAVARHLGARAIVVAEPVPARRRLAEKIGATAVIDPGQEPLAGLASHDGFTVALEMSGEAAALAVIIAHAAPACRVAALGLPSSRIDIDWAAAVTKMITFQGVYGRRMFATWQMMTSLLEAGLSIENVITDRYHFADYQRAFAAAGTRTAAGKVLLEWAGT
jgi:threonine 3-dehydrogenase